MGRKSKVDTLPGTILQKLQDRLIDSAHGDFDGHEAWLKESGYNISKSAVHRYSRIMRNLPVDGLEPSNDADVSCVDLRMRCLEIASIVEPETDTIDLAKSLFFWVTTGRRI